MKLLADENFSFAVVKALRKAGHDVLWIRTHAAGIRDEEVISLAREEDRLLLTFDKDFGELLFRVGLKLPTGVILFRLPPLSPQIVARIVTRTIESRSDWHGYFSVVDRRRVRMTPLPQ